jgi:hypothetical protein
MVLHNDIQRPITSIHYKKNEYPDYGNSVQAFSGSTLSVGEIKTPADSRPRITQVPFYSKGGQGNLLSTVITSSILWNQRRHEFRSVRALYLRPYESSIMHKVTIIDFSDEVSLSIPYSCRWPRATPFCLGSLAVCH